MTNNKNAIICFLKYPETGKVKTRLAKDIGDINATNFYKQIAQETVQKAKQTNADIFIFYSPPQNINLKKFKTWLGKDFEYKPQQEGDLGCKMTNAFIEVFAKNYSKIVIIGSDIPQITPEILGRAFSLLEKGDTVIGPSPDGGYYLLGFNKNSFFPQVFENIEWSTDTVYKETISKLEKFAKTYLTLESLEDVDDLQSYNRYINRGK
ncbi:MAG: glycosyltransferase [Elusimicrobiaceae bacterium]|jgi:uncharacterized protein|nr:glycosyltransferase [Elusimicrobiaceae bacterium]MBT3954796.1 glycosyltransferase [Elusimicrobiaceae bacterium]MBT4008790.1 glycosyltransferase [Elusimicrobiaceae bacterium]MBT4402266.1 glycosyltransferase [Elusimicrobiaceae bacterium]MBT4440277.1 glycosyltransferase [Elusimicrobiaceae bacterium]